MVAVSMGFPWGSGDRLYAYVPVSVRLKSITRYKLKELQSLAQNGTGYAVNVKPGFQDDDAQ